MQVTRLSNAIPNESDAKTAVRSGHVGFKELQRIKLPADKDTRSLQSSRCLQDLVHQASGVRQFGSLNPVNSLIPIKSTSTFP